VNDVWLPHFACPDCRIATRLDADDASLWCASCGQRYERIEGIYRFLSRTRAELAERFLRQYRAIRERDGFRDTAPEYYRMLPFVRKSDPRSTEWRVRRESYAHLQRSALPGVWEGPMRVLDLGAGSGWLSHRLASFGHSVVAVDRLDDDRDGLGVCQHYAVPFAAVQADFDALPFPDGEFDVVILNGSLHYSVDPARTLGEARRALASGGVLVVMDSPMFDRKADGAAMVEAQLRSFVTDYGIVDAVQPGVGYLTFEELHRTAQALGLRDRFVHSRGPLMWRLRRALSRWRIRRAPAAFGVWVAQ
jgi:SAM-dependent methyltransferase